MCIAHSQVLCCAEHVKARLSLHQILSSAPAHALQRSALQHLLYVICSYHDDKQISRQESSGFASWMQKAHCGKHGRGQFRPHMQEQQNNSSAAAEELQEDGQLFPAWLTQQVVHRRLTSAAHLAS